MKIQYLRNNKINQSKTSNEIYGLKVYEDIISSSVAFNDRPVAQQLMNDIDNHIVTEVVVHSIALLGNSTMDILYTLKRLARKGINVISKTEGFETMFYGTENPMAKMMISMLTTFSELEINRIKASQLKGIAMAKAKGNYQKNGGKPKESIEQFFMKKKNSKCYDFIKNKGKSLREASALSGVSYGTSAKISRYIKRGVLL